MDPRAVGVRAVKQSGPTVVSILNLKGGVGKTTVAALLAYYVSRNGYRTLAVDIDPQANLSQALMGEERYTQLMANHEPSIVELFDGFVAATGRKPAPSPVNVDAIIKSVGTNTNLELLPSRFDFSDNLVKASSQMDEKTLARFISQEMSDRDLIIIDCAPTESILTRAAYHASRYVLIPVRTEFFATIGFPLMKKSLDNFRTNNHGYQIEVCGVLINWPDTSGSGQGVHPEEAMREIREQTEGKDGFGWPILDEHMYYSRGYPKLMKDGLFAPYQGNAAHEWQPVAKCIMQAINLDIPEDEWQKFLKSILVTSTTETNHDTPED